MASSSTTNAAEQRERDLARRGGLALALRRGDACAVAPARWRQHCGRCHLERLDQQRLFRGQLERARVV
jgi:hypothetical protein